MSETLLHVWKIGPGHFVAIIALASAPKSAHVYKVMLAHIKALSHVTLETNASPDSASGTAPWALRMATSPDTR